MARWHFYYPKRISFYPPDYESPGLGGSEAVLVLLTRQLARRGHVVEVFNCCYRPGIYDGVRWRMAWELVEADQADVGVSVRFEEALCPDLRAKKHVFWMLDDRPQGAAAFASRYQETGTVIIASRAMLNRLRASKVRAQIVQIPHPVETKRFEPRSHRALACLFSSMPNRGLDVALSIWPQIRHQVPEAELWITSGWQLWGYMKAEAEDRWRIVIGERPLPDGVKLFGSVSRDKLCRLQESAWIGLYPCRFPEMFCLSAAESAAAGTPLVTSSLEALTERVDHNRTGVLIEGPIDDPRVQATFVSEAVSLLKSPTRRNAYGVAAEIDARKFDVDSVAARWEELSATTAAAN